MIKKAKIDNIIPILKKDCKRALKMYVKGFPKPYYCSLLLRDVNWFNTWASSGSTYRKRSDHTRNVNCDIRVGSYKYDQTTEGCLYDNDDDVESYTHVKVPIDDKDYEGLRIAIWRLSEAKFREALTDYSNKEAARLSTVNPHAKLASFTKLKSIKSIKYANPEKMDEEKWVKFCKQASKWLSDLTKVSGNYVEFDGTQETKIFVNSENRVIVQHKQVFSIAASIRRLTSKGSQIEQELVINAASQKDLPTLAAFKKMALEKYKRLNSLTKAKKIHSFSGPVLLYPMPAGLLFHEAIGHRLEGSRLLSSGEGKTFAGQIGKQVISAPVNIYDDPTLKTYKGEKLIGSYDFDDEGTKATKAELVKEGKLVGFLNSRAEIPSKNNVLNGHARNRNFQRAISRMGVTVVEGLYTSTMNELKQRLVEEIIAQGKPFGMIVYETSNGETDTTAYDFQAFSGEISYATLIFPNGKEVPIRGVDFVGTPLQALNNIIAVGDDMMLDNHYCGAESGFIHVSTICPAILLSDLELQAKEEELVTQYILPRPKG